MAIAFVAAGTRLKVDIAASTPTQNIALPAGHIAGHVILLFIVVDNNFNIVTPPGWTLLDAGQAGSSTQTPYAGRPRLMAYYIVDTGSLGSNVSVTFGNQAWPIGKPYVIAFTAAYSGCDTSGPVETRSLSTSTATTAAQAHPQLTTVSANDWLLTFRAVGADAAKTFTNSVGTDSERVDDTLGLPAGMSVALYDSNAALAPGLQTQRTTTASATVEYGSVMYSLALKPSGAANATPSAQEATAVGAAFNATVTAVNGDWDRCGSLPSYSFAVDWGQDGSFTDPDDDVTGDIISEVSLTYGRDQERQLSPSSVGSAAFTLNNSTRRYSPENTASPLSGDLDPARDMRAQVTFSTVTYDLFRGKIDDYNMKVDRGDRTVDFTFLDGMSTLAGIKLSTAVYESMRTGELVDTVLDLAGWTGGRDIDLGATVVKYWWAEGTDALAAIQDLVKSEGPPSVAYQAPDGTFVFRDRHHRLLRSQSLEAQATFSAAEVACDSPAATGLHFTKPFTYAHGWRDIVNSVSFDVSERTVDADLTVVWSSDTAISLSTGESREIELTTSDPFKDAVTPLLGTDFTVSGAGTVNAVLDRTSGASAKISLLAVGAPVVISGLQLRARAIPVQRTVKVVRQDTGSISQHGEKLYPDSAPWANANDADAIATMILLHYAQRRPTVTIRIVTEDPAHFVQILTRTVSDRIRIVNGEAGLDDDFFVERVTHTIQRMNWTGKPPVHSVVLGCEKQLTVTSNPFRFDVRGAGFDEGVFDPISADDPSTVFIFDHPTQGLFDTGLFGT